MAENLKNCPFCGFDGIPTGHGSASCSNRGSVSSDIDACPLSDIHLTIPGWNRRAPSPAIEKAREALSSACGAALNGKQRECLAYIKDALALLEVE
jgi:hypothetical protein